MFFFILWTVCHLQVIWCDPTMTIMSKVTDFDTLIVRIGLTKREERKDKREELKMKGKVLGGRKF